MDDEIARLRRRGTWTSLQRGAYVVGAPALGRRARHLLVLRATPAGLRTPAVVSHASAAALHGLPLWGVPLQQGHVTRRGPARTDSDTQADLRAVLETATGSRGARAAGRVVEAADGRSESVGESRSRAILIELGLPLPDLQVEVRRADGVLVGRSDVGWRTQRLLGEFDGRVKYGRLLRPGQDPGDAVFAEKQPEDAMRAENWGMARWVWRDLDPPAAFGRRIADRLS